MTGNGEVSESRTQALLKEAAVTEAQERSAGITLAWVALRITGGDQEAAKEMLGEVLEAAGFIPYEAVQLKRRISNNLVHDRRPGQ